MSAPPTPTAPSPAQQPDLDVSIYKQRVAQLEKEVRGLPDVEGFGWMGWIVVRLGWWWWCG